MKKRILSLFFGLSSVSLAFAQENRIQIIQRNIESVFYQPESKLYSETNDSAHNEKPHSYLWPLCALIQAADEYERLESNTSYLPKILSTIQLYYNPYPPAAGYQAYVAKAGKDTRYYDDNQWIAIACLDAYSRTHTKKYLDTAELIYHCMMTGYDTKGGGGIYWRENDGSSKNTCSNGPGILVALQLYAVTKDKKYLNTALDLYRWTNTHLQTPKGVYYDAVKIPSMKIDSALYTYNTGTMLESNVQLYRLTKQASYLTEARRVAKAAIDKFYRRESFPDHYWFNVVLLRGFLALYEVDRDPKYVQLFQRYGEKIWKEERDGQNLLGKKKWKTLIDQAALLELYARLERWKHSKK